MQVMRKIQGLKVQISVNSTELLGDSAQLTW